METTYLTFCPKLKGMLETGLTRDEGGKEVPTQGTSTMGNLRAIRETILKERCSRTLEIGLAYGASALAFLSTLTEASPADHHHTALDPFQRKVWGGAGLRAVEDAGYSDHFTWLEAPSCIRLPRMLAEGARFDLIYVDGSHIFEDVFIDFYYSARLLREGGIVLFDDCSDRHVRKVIRFIQRNFREWLQEIDYREIDDPEKPLKKKIGNHLGVRQLRGFRKVLEINRPWDATLIDF